MNLLPSGALVPVKRIDAETFSGSFPSWIVDGSTGGTTEAYDATHAGGFWELDPGSERPGDEARLRTSFALRPDAYDVVEFATRVSVSTTDVDDVEFLTGLEAGDGDGLLYSYLNAGDELGDRLRVRSDGADVGYDARTIDDVRQHEIELRWYTTEDRVELYTDRVLGATAEDVGLVTSAAYTPTWCATYGGGERAAMRIHAASIRYCEQANP